MIRLYPKVLQAEQNIQVLRRKVKDAELANQSTAGRMSSAQQQIHELSGQLLRAERERQEILQELGGAELMEVESRESYEEVQREVFQLRGQLCKSEQDATDRLRSLQKAEHESVTLRGDVGKTERALRERLGHLVQAERKKQEVQAAWESTSCEAHDLRCELEASRHEGREFRIRLARSMQRGDELCGWYVEEECTNAELTCTFAEMRLAEGELAGKVHRLSGLDERNAELQARLREATLFGEEMSGEVDASTRGRCDLRRELDEERRKDEALLERFQAQHAAMENLSVLFEGSEHSCHGFEERLHKSEQASDALKSQLRTVEAEASAREQADQVLFDSIGLEKHELEAKVNVLEPDCHQLRQELASSEKTSANLRSSLKNEENQKERLMQDHCELELELDAARKKCQCAIA
mmetsp:Transcript_18682/g.51259  ORF Transcript_18682/g.51259 Transcript_18682/m.51259 type:complete len:413 (+) Transcript_18682:188-1426(+)